MKCGNGVANGIQEAEGKIPFSSTRKTKGFRRDPEALFLMNRHDRMLS